MPKKTTQTKVAMQAKTTTKKISKAAPQLLQGQG